MANSNYTVVTEVNGTFVIDLGVIDTTQTSLNLIGKNAFGAGQAIAANTIAQLSNFASPNQPLNPLLGQLWYNSATKSLSVHTGESGAEWEIVSNGQDSALYVAKTDFYDGNGDSLYQLKSDLSSEFQLIDDNIAAARFESPVLATYSDMPNHIVVTYSPAVPSSLTPGLFLYLIAPATNSGAVTINANGNALPLVSMEGLPLAGNEIVGGQSFVIKSDYSRWFLVESGNYKFTQTPPTSDNSYLEPNTKWVQQAIAAALGSVASPGEIKPWVGMNAPTGWAFCYGQELNRMTNFQLFSSLSLTVSGNVTSGSATITALSVNPMTAGIAVGMPISGPGIPSGSFIASITTSSVTMNNQATAPGTQETIVIAPWGVGDGTLTFNAPDLRGRSLVGRDNMGGTPAGNVTLAGSGIDGTRLGAGGGEQTHVLSIAETPTHSHTGTTVSNGAHTHTVETSGRTIYTTLEAGQPGMPTMIPIELATTGTLDYAIPQDSASVSTTTDSAGAHTHTFTTSNSGTGNAHNNMQPVAIVNYVIKL